MAKSSPVTQEELALLNASRSGDLEQIQTLIAQGVNVNARSKGVAPPLAALIGAAANTTSMVFHNGKLVPEGQKLWERKESLLDAVRALLSAGADPDGSPDELPLLRLAGRVPDDIRLPIARLLLEKGANPDAVDKQGNSPLLVAALYKSTQYARLLLHYPVDVNRLATRGTILDIVEDNINSAGRDMKSARTDAIRGQFQAELIDHESLRELLKSSGAKHQSELDIPVERPPGVERHIASDFLDLIHRGEREWALLAVKAPFEAVSDAYFAFSKSRTRLENVPLRAAADAEEIPRVTAIVKVRKSPWTLVLHTIFFVRASHLKHVAAAAKELSSTLKTRAITYVGTEESDDGDCELFEKKKRISKAGEKKAIALLTREGVILPAFYPARAGGRTWLAVEGTSSDQVERADVVEPAE